MQVGERKLIGVADSERGHVAHDDADQRAAYWPFALGRAIPLAAVAVWITFTSNHGPTFGLLAFGVFGIVAGLVLGILAWFRLAGTGARSFFVAQAGVTALLGILALVLRTSGVAFEFFLFTAFGVITGFLELYCGVRARRRFVASRDWLTIGGLTVIVGLAFLLVPPGFSQSFKDPDGVTRVLDSSVIIVGLLGLYAAISAVFLIIAALSAKWGTQQAVTPPSETVPSESEHAA